MVLLVKSPGHFPQPLTHSEGTHNRVCVGGGGDTRAIMRPRVGLIPHLHDHVFSANRHKQLTVNAIRLAMAHADYHDLQRPRHR